MEEILQKKIAGIAEAEEEVEIEENGKQVLKTATVGYSLRQEDPATRSVVMIVPQNSRPIIECDVKFLRKM